MGRPDANGGVEVGHVTQLVALPGEVLAEGRVGDVGRRRLLQGQQNIGPLQVERHDPLGVDGHLGRAEPMVDRDRARRLRGRTCGGRGVLRGAVAAGAAAGRVGGGRRGPSARSGRAETVIGDPVASCSVNLTSSACVSGQRPEPCAAAARRGPCGARGRACRGQERGMDLTEHEEALCEQSTWDFTDLRALFINCTLKRSPELSNTQGLVDRSHRDHAPAGRDGRRGPGRRPRHRHRRLAGHDRARLGARRVAGALRAGDGRRHPRPRRRRSGSATSRRSARG